MHWKDDNARASQSLFCPAEWARIAESLDTEEYLSGVIDDIWGVFAGMNVQRRDGTQMGYYRQGMQRSSEVAGLLELANGDCTAWARLLRATFLAQGIASDVKELGATDAFEGLLVSIWNFIGDGRSSDITAIAGETDAQKDDLIDKYPYYNVVSSDGTITTVDAEDLVGLGGQAESDPESVFAWHRFVKLQYEDGGIDIVRYLDPSYGVEYDAGTDAEAAEKFHQNLAGFFYMPGDWHGHPEPVDVTIGGVQKRVILMRTKAADNDPPEVEVR